MHNLSFFTHAGQWCHVFLMHVELPCAFWNEASSLLRDTTTSGRTSSAGISLCKE